LVTRTDEHRSARPLLLPLPVPLPLPARSQQSLRADREHARRRGLAQKANNHWAEINSGKDTYRIV